MKLKRGIKNFIWGILGQIVILSLGLLIPRLLIVEYGSEVNGLFSSVNQIFSYVALLEAGIGAATVQALYKPIIASDRNSISQVLSATKHYYKKVSLYYFLCAFFLSLVFPLLVQSNLSKFQIGLIILLQGLSGVINFYFQATLKLLLTAEGKNYVISNVTLLVQILTSVLKVFLILNSSSIIYLQLSYFVVSILQMLVYYIYFKRKYHWVDFKANPDFTALKQKNSFLIHQISLLIFSSTDMIILSVFCDFKVVSVYAIYNLIFMSLNSITNTIHNSVSFTLGHVYHEDKKRYLKLHDAYDNYYISFIFSIISICYILIIPFLDLYTAGIEDINYIDTKLAILFSLIQLMTSTRIVSNNLIRVAGHVKQTVNRTLIELLINISVSLIMVNVIGMYGVLIGTIVALLYRTVDIIYYANKIIIKRSCNKVIKVIFINSLLFISVIILSNYFTINIVSYFSFLLYAFVLCLILIPAFLIINSISNKESFLFVFNILKKKIGK